MERKKEDPLVIDNKSCKRFFILDTTKVYFNAQIDSGNLEKVQQVSPYTYRLIPGFDKTRNTSERTFFYFRVAGFRMCSVKFIVMKQCLLDKFVGKDSDAYRPVYRTDSNESFQVLPKNLQVKINKNGYDQAQLSFCFQFHTEQWVQFAFSYPYSYSKLQSLLKELSEKYSKHDDIYYHDELIFYTEQNRNLHAITITQKINCLKERQKHIEGLFPFGQSHVRPFKINKPIVVLSGRVHPGQTPASYCIEGALRFLTNQKDYRAYLLRKHFHFIIVPMLNPDAVYHGMFRSDMNGNNLNRLYMHCTPKGEPSIWSFRKFLESLTNVQFYFDFHAHPSKKGFFIYGNAFDEFTHQVEAETFGKLIQFNCPYFENLDSVFSEKQMNIKNPNDQYSKQGCARVFVHKLFNNIIHCYTVECGYFSPNKLNYYSKINHQQVHSGNYSYDNCWEHFSMKQYTPQSYFIMGKSILITILDLFHINPYPRVTLGQFKAISTIRKVVALRIYHQAERFRMIDSNCYKKIKQIKKYSESYFKDRFEQHGLTISQNYGMKAKRKRFSLNARIYMRNSTSLKKIKSGFLNNIQKIQNQDRQQKLNQKVKSHFQSSIMQENSQNFNSQDQEDDDIRKLGQYIQKNICNLEMLEKDLYNFDDYLLNKKLLPSEKAIEKRQTPSILHKLNLLADQDKQSSISVAVRRQSEGIINIKPKKQQSNQKLQRINEYLVRESNKSSLTKMPLPNKKKLNKLSPSAHSKSKKKIKNMLPALYNNHFISEMKIQKFFIGDSTSKIKCQRLPQL